jgi:periplasmic protein TonB
MPTLHDSRTLAAWLAASVALHAALVLALPVVRMIEESRPSPLEVTLQRIEPPRVIPSPPELKPLSAPAPREKPAPRKEAKRVPVPETVPQREPPPVPARELAPAPPIIALPQSESPVRVPAAEAEATPRQETPRAASSVGKTDAAGREPAPAALTPPSFNAAYLRNPPPRYPVSARRNGEQGTVTLRVFVTRDGVPSTVSVHTTSGSSALDQAAVEAVKGWRFMPARQGPEPVEAWVLVPIVFKLDGVS